MLLYDGGTVKRPYEFSTRREAEEYYKRKVLSDRPIYFADGEKFKQAVAKQTITYNGWLMIMPGITSIIFVKMAERP